MSVYKKLQQARIKLQSTKLSKSGLNKFAGFQYFELGDFLPSAQSIFSEVGLSSSITFQADIATLTIVDVDDADKPIVFTCPIVIPTMKGCNEIQSLGAMMTYIRRYLYVNALEIVEHDAIDATSGKSDVRTPSNANPTSGYFESQSKEIQDVILETAANIESVWESDITAAIKIFEDAVEGDDDLKVALWSKLGSKCRSAIKKEKAK